MEKIPHRAKDGFYLCLLHLPIEKLRPMLAEIEMPNTWFQEHLAGLADSGEQPAGVAAILDEQVDALEADSALEVLDVARAPAVIHENAWFRCWVSRGEGTDRVKVWFDNYSHNSGRPRGWVNCSCHGCIKYVWADLFDSRLDFCAWVYTWRFGYEDETRSKPRHLRPRVGDRTDPSRIIAALYS